VFSFSAVLYVNSVYNINRFVLQECGDFTWRVPDCEELVGVTAIGDFSQYLKFPFTTTAMRFPFEFCPFVFQKSKNLLEFFSKPQQQSLFQLMNQPQVQ